MTGAHDSIPPMPRLTHIITALICIMLMQTPLPAATPSSRNANRVVARVNADLITQSDIDHYIRRYKRAHGGEAPTKSKALEEVMDSLLLRQIATKAGYIPTDSEISTIVEEQIAELRKQYGSQAKFDSALRNTGYTMGTLRADMRKEVLADLQIQHTIGSRVSMSQIESKEERQKNIDATDTEIHLCRLGIVFGAEADKTQEEATEELTDLLKEIKSSGLDFQKSIRKFVKETDLENGTVQLDDFGLKKSSELAKTVPNAVVGMNAQSWTKPIVTGQTVSAFYILAKRDAHTIYYENKYTKAREDALRTLRPRTRVTIFADDYKSAMPAKYRQKGTPGTVTKKNR